MRNRLFTLLLLVLFASVSLSIALTPGRDFSYAENRPLSRIPRPSTKSWLKTAFQASLESGLSDQWPGSEPLKTLHAKMGRRWLAFSGEWLVGLVQKATPPQPADSQAAVPPQTVEAVIPVGGNVFALGSAPTDPLVVADANPHTARTAMHETAEVLAELARTLPTIPFDTFYIETSIDMDFLSGAVTHEFLNAFEEALPKAISSDALRLASTGELRQWFYRTDHHWNAAGQQQGYARLLTLLSKNTSAAMVPVPTEILTLPSLPFSGSRARSANDFSRAEPFDLLTFDLPPHEVWVDGTPGRYGNREQYVMYASTQAGEGTGPESGTETASEAAAGPSVKALSSNGIGTDAGFNHYGHCNGQDYAEVVFRFPENRGMGHLLVLSESYANPLKPLIASHFDTTRFIDLRFYESTFHKPFNPAAYVAEHRIDQVLVMGSHAYFRKLPQWLDAGNPVNAAALDATVTVRGGP